MTKDEIYEEMISEFDFEKVHKVMTLLDWTWVDSGKLPPTIERMKMTVRELFDQIYSSVNRDKRDHSVIATGGFQITYTECKSYNMYELEFVVENWRVRLD